MPGTLGIEPNYGRVPIKGGGKGPKFPMPLDHPSSGLGIKGGVNAEQRPVRGTSGPPSAPPRGYGVVAPRPPRGIPQAAPARPPKVFSQPLRAATRENIRTGAGLTQYGKEHPRAYVKGGLFGLLPGHYVNLRPGETQQSWEASLPRSKEMAVPALPGTTFLAGASALGKLGEKSGVGGIVGKGSRELVNLPTQTLAALVKTGEAGVSAAGGNLKPLKEEGKELAHQSAIAHLVTTGDVHGALKIAGEHPVGTGLELWGLGNAADSLAGRLKAPKMTDDNVKDVSRAPKELVPGGATQAQMPYAQAPIRNLFQRKAGARPLKPATLSRALRKHFDQFQSDALGVTRNTREKVITNAIRRIKVGRGRINDGAIQSHGDFLAKPGEINPATGREFYHEQLERRIRETGPPDRTETPREKQAREDYRSHLIGLQDLPLEKRMESYRAAMNVAKGKRGREPEFEKANVYTHEEMANAKRAAAFQFHFADQLPHYDPNYAAGESPFHLGGENGPTISRAQVDAQLRRNGVNPDQLSFTSARPYQNTQAPFATGFRNAITGSTKGKLSGMNFLHGQKDPSYEAVIRQELAEHQILNHSRAQAVFNKNYVYGKEYIAKQIEAGLDKLSPARRASAEQFIARHLRDGERHFNEGEGRTAKENSAVANEFLKEAQPNHPDLVPVRVSHMFAKNRERGTVGRLEDLHDHLDPNRLGMEGESMLGEHAGPYGLVHHAVADQLNTYEKYLGSYHPLSQWASFWRRNAVAWSPRHPAGVTNEILGRLLAAEAGPISYLQHTRLLREIRAQVAKSDDPALKHALNVYESRMGVGTHAANTMLNERFTTPRDWQQMIEKVRLEKPVDWWRRGETRQITGAPLRGIKTIFKGYNAITHEIVRLERKYLEHPLIEPLAGKAQAQEYRRLTGKRMKFYGAVDKVEKEFMAGRMNPKAIDHAFNVYKSSAGDWQRSSPFTKKAMSYVPFWQWAANALRFIYVTMPLHHPMKTAALVAMEHATEEARKAEGQGYPNIKSLFVGEKGFLQPSQQGSLPLGKGRLGLEYYWPSGVVSGGVEGAVNFFGSYATGTYELAHGRSPITGHELKESEQNEIGQLLLLNLFENAIPPARYGKEIAEGQKPGHVFRPFRTEKTRSIKGVKPGILKGVEKAEPAEKPEKAERPEKAEKPEKAERP